MEPAKRDLRLYRTAWIDGQRTLEDHFPYSREYPSLAFAPGSVLEINIISSFSRTPYREDDDVGSDHYRYELHVPQGSPILELDRFVTHNEDGEVLIPPMSCRVAAIDNTGYQRRKGVVALEYEGPLSVT